MAGPRDPQEERGSMLLTETLNTPKFIVKLSPKCIGIRRRRLCEIIRFEVMRMGTSWQD